MYLRSAHVCAIAHICDRPDLLRRAECMIYIHAHINYNIQNKGGRPDDNDRFCGNVIHISQKLNEEKLRVGEIVETVMEKRACI